VAASSAPPPPLEIELLGTIIESNHSTALFSLPGGEVQFCSVGETVGKSPNQAKVQEILGDEVTLVYRDQSVTLQVPASF